MAISYVLAALALLPVAHGFSYSGFGRRASFARKSANGLRSVKMPKTRASALPTLKPDEASFTGITSVGSPVVHRYMRDEGEEWKMWFQGRDAGIEPEIVSLSTGRIFRATSTDGFTWEKEEGVGTFGSSLDVNIDEWWGFDTAHVGLGDVRLGDSGKVMTTGGGVYTMYYFGGTYETGGDDQDDKVAGLDLRVGVALSQDGMNWSRLEGEHPTGCALDIGSGDEGGPQSSLIGWPQVVNHQERVFRMYFTTFDSTSQRYSIGLATSEDSFKWSPLGLVFGGSGGQGESGSASFDCAGVARAQVLKDMCAEGWPAGGRSKDLPAVVPYTMFYEGIGSDGRSSIGFATSSDGVKWTAGNEGKALLEPPNDDESAWEVQSVGSPFVMNMGGGALRMYYSGTSKDGVSSIGCAECDDFIQDPSNWRRVSAS